MARLLAVLVGVVIGGSGCIETTTQVCGTQICPADTTCRPDLGKCFSDAQLTACNGVANGEACTFDDRTGVCLEGACTSAECGDGIIIAPEDCEGADLGGMSCAALGYYDEAGLACSNRCTFDVTQCTGFCGDGVVNGDGAEVCDSVAPSDIACVDFGFSIGAPGCRLCGPDFSSCEHIGFRRTTAIAETDSVLGVGGTGPDDVWLVGGDIVAHFDGSNWTEIPHQLPFILGVAVRGKDDVEVLASGRLAHYNGETWTEIVIPTQLNYVWGDATRTFMVGSQGYIYRVENGVVNDESLPGGPTFNGVWGIGDTIIAVSSDGNAYHRDAIGNWAPRTLGSGRAGFAVFGFAANDIYAAGGSIPGNFVSHWDGSSWTQIYSANGNLIHLRAIWGSSPSNVMIVGNGVALQIDGLAAAALENPPAFTTAIWGSSIDDVWIPSRFDEVYRWSGAGWAQSGPITGSLGALDVEILDRDNVMVVGEYGHVAMWTGSGWIDTQPMSDGYLPSVWAADANNWYTSDYDGVRHFDGAQWTTVATGLQADVYEGIWGVDNDNIFFVSNQSIVMKKGASWSRIAAADLGIASLNLKSVWGRSASDVWAVGYQGLMLHYDGASWSVVASNTMDDITDVWGDEDELFVIVDQTLSRFDAGVITRVNTRSAGAINVLTDGPPDGLAYAGGNNGLMFAYDGAEWSPMATNTTSDINAIGFGDDLIVGAEGNFGSGAQVLIRATDH